jgi:transcriptional regulator with XRE-family HTH domain
MSTPVTLAEWLQSHSLTKSKFLSLAFVSERTYDDLIKGSRSVPSLQRIYLLTQLPSFKPTEDELSKYAQLTTEKKKLSDQLDFAIAEQFILLWRGNGQLPLLDETLQVSHAEKRNKQELAKFLGEKYFILEDGKYVPIQNPVPVIPALLPEETNHCEQALLELYRVGKLSPDEQRGYVHKNSSVLKSLYGVLVILTTSPDPVVAFEDINQSRNHFLTVKISKK